MTSRTHGTKMRLVPFYYSDGEGGIMVRVVLDENKVFYSHVPRELALRQIEQLARLLIEAKK